jgi:hypothetical protein
MESSGEQTQISESENNKIPFIELSDFEASKWHAKIREKLEKTGIQGPVGIRLFDNKFLSTSLQFGTDRKVQPGQKQLDFYGPSFTDTKKDYSIQEAIMKKRNLSPEDVTWAFNIGTSGRYTFPNIDLDPNLAIIVYDLDQLEELSYSFFTFKTNPKEAALLIASSIPPQEMTG